MATATPFSSSSIWVMKEYGVVESWTDPSFVWKRLHWEYMFCFLHISKRNFSVKLSEVVGPKSSFFVLGCYLNLIHQSSSYAVHPVYDCGFCFLTLVVFDQILQIVSKLKKSLIFSNTRALGHYEK